MHTYLLSQNELQSALKLGTSNSAFDQQLLLAFDRGNRERFFSIWSLLERNPKLQFYFRVYFLIHSIHPSLSSNTVIPREQMNCFKEYLESKGAELVKTNEFLEFYALPFIKNPLKHPAFAGLFKKDWITNLRQKLVGYLREEVRRVKKEGAREVVGGGSVNREDRGEDSERGNRELMQSLNEYIEKYKVLEHQYKAAVELANSTIMETQNKWFQITKDLVNCSKSLIQLTTQNNRAVTSERKFLNIKKKIDKYDKFVNKRIQDMITQSQDISIFDRPSINELSCTLTQYTQKNITSITIDDYIPTDFMKLKQDLIDSSEIQRACTIIKGLTWRILKSKDASTRRQNTIGVLMHDTLGIRTSSIKSLLSMPALLPHLLRLIYYIQHDYYGRTTMFSTGLIKILIPLLKSLPLTLPHLQYLIPMLQILSVRQDMKLQMIHHGVIKFYLQLLKDHLQKLPEVVIENIVATLLNLCSRPEGIDRFEEEQEVFHVLGGLLECEYPLTRVIVNGTIYSLLGRRGLFQMALAVGLNEVVGYIIEHDPTANLKELRYLEERLIKFEPSKIVAKPASQSDDKDEILEEDSVLEYDEDITNIDEYIRAHEMICSEYTVSQHEAQKQTEEVREIFDLTIKKVKEMRHIENSKTRQRNSETKNPRRQLKVEKQNKTQQTEPIQPHKPSKENYQSMKEPTKQSESENELAHFMLRNSVKEKYVYQSPDKNNSPRNSKPREQVLKKLNEQIRASKFTRQNQSEVNEQKHKIHSFNESKKEERRQPVDSGVPFRRETKPNEKPKANESAEYHQVFAAKPKIRRSPPGTPEKSDRN